MAQVIRKESNVVMVYTHGVKLLGILDLDSDDAPKLTKAVTHLEIPMATEQGISFADKITNVPDVILGDFTYHHIYEDSNLYAAYVEVTTGIKVSKNKA